MDKKGFFNQMAGSWDQRFYTGEMEKYLRRLVSLFQLRPGSWILDVGAGTGGIIPYLLRAIGPQGASGVDLPKWSRWAGEIPARRSQSIGLR
jgi:ubiquinone/menaquinone biosynthesis C-methylase UbiE